MCVGSRDAKYTHTHLQMLGQINFNSSAFVTCDESTTEALTTRFRYAVLHCATADEIWSAVPEAHMDRVTAPETRHLSEGAKGKRQENTERKTLTRPTCWTVDATMGVRVRERRSRGAAKVRTIRERIRSCSCCSSSGGSHGRHCLTRLCQLADAARIFRKQKQN